MSADLTTVRGEGTPIQKINPKSLIEFYETLLQEKRYSLTVPVWDTSPLIINKELRKQLLEFMQGEGREADEGILFRKKMEALGISAGKKNKYIEEYKQLLPVLKLAEFFEKRGNSEEQTMKLILAFGTKDKVLQYLKKVEKKYPRTVALIQEACRFSLPKTKWSFEIWQSLANKYMPKRQFIDAFSYGAEIEAYVNSRREALEKHIEETALKQKKKILISEYESNIKAKAQIELGKHGYVKNKMLEKRPEFEKSCIKKINAKAREALGIPAKQDKVSEEENQLIDNYLKSQVGIEQAGRIRSHLSNELLESVLAEYKGIVMAVMLGKEAYLAERLEEEAESLKEEINQQKHGIFSKTTTLETLSRYYGKLLYERGDENPEAANLFSKHKMSNQALNIYLDLEKRDSHRIPPMITDKKSIPILVEGSDIGYPQYYLTKLSPEDPRAAILGHLSGCCQHLDNEHGRSCVEHGMASEEGGNYVICKRKNRHSVSHEDTVIAQCWAWRSKKDLLVIDSIEMSDHYRDEWHHRIISDFFAYWAEILVTKYNVPRVLVGKGRTPEDLGFLMPLRNEWSRDYLETEHRDSRVKQLIIADRVLPFIEFRRFLVSGGEPRSEKVSSQACSSEIKIKIEREELERCLLEWCDIIAFNAHHPNFKNPIFSDNTISDLLSFPMHRGRFSCQFKALGLNQEALNKRFLLTKETLQLLNQGKISQCLKKLEQGASSSLRGWINGFGTSEFGNGKTLLMLACEKRGLEQCKRIVSRTKETVHEKDDACGRTALMYAASAGNLKAVRILLEQTSASESINDRDIDNWSALTHAIYLSNNIVCVDLIDLLLKFKAKIGSNDLVIAVDKEDVGAVKTLIKGGVNQFINERTSTSETLLIIAASKNSRAASGIVNVLLEAGAGESLHERDEQGTTAWMSAFDSENSEVLHLLSKELVKQGKKKQRIEPSKGKQNYYGRTEIMWAAASGDAKRVCELIKTETLESLQREDLDYKNALMLAAENGDVETLTCLIEAYKRVGYDIDTHNKELDRTALMMASQFGNGEAVLALWSAGSDIRKKNRKGQTALMLATVFGKVEVADRLNAELVKCQAQAQAYGRTNLMQAVIALDRKQVFECLKTANEAFLRRQDIDGRNALMFAAEKGDVEIVALLLKGYGKSINPQSLLDLRDSSMRSALMLACQSGNIQTVIAILEFSANYAENGSFDTIGETEFNCAENCKNPIIRKIFEFIKCRDQDPIDFEKICSVFKELLRLTQYDVMSRQEGFEKIASQIADLSRDAEILGLLKAEIERFKGENKKAVEVLSVPEQRLEAEVSSQPPPMLHQYSSAREIVPVSQLVSKLEFLRALVLTDSENKSEREEMLLEISVLQSRQTFTLGTIVSDGVSLGEYIVTALGEHPGITDRVLKTFQQRQGMAASPLS